jgi:transcriptional regulator of acetoin/glycerol metabolism
MTLDDAEKAILLNALEQARNNVSQAARQLGITRMTMRYRMDKHGISV